MTCEQNTIAPDPDSDVRPSQSNRLRIPVLFRFMGVAAFLFCWGVIMTIADWGRRVPLTEFDYRIPVRGFGDFYLDPWFGLAFYASAVISAVYIPLQALSDQLRKSSMAEARDASFADATKNSEREL